MGNINEKTLTKLYSRSLYLFLIKKKKKLSFYTVKLSQFPKLYYVQTKTQFSIK